MLHVTMGLGVKGSIGRASGGRSVEPLSGLSGGEGPAGARHAAPLVWAELMPRVDSFRLTKRDITALESALRGLKQRAKEA